MASSFLFFITSPAGTGPLPTDYLGLQATERIVAHHVRCLDSGKGCCSGATTKEIEEVVGSDRETLKPAEVSFALVASREAALPVVGGRSP